MQRYEIQIQIRSIDSVDPRLTRVAARWTTRSAETAENKYFVVAVLSSMDVKLAHTQPTSWYTVSRHWYTVYQTY